MPGRYLEFGLMFISNGWRISRFPRIGNLLPVEVSWICVCIQRRENRAFMLLGWPLQHRDVQLTRWLAKLIVRAPSIHASLSVDSNVDIKWAGSRLYCVVTSQDVLWLKMTAGWYRPSNSDVKRHSRPPTIIDHDYQRQKILSSSQ